MHVNLGEYVSVSDIPNTDSEFQIYLKLILKY